MNEDDVLSLVPGSVSDRVAGITQAERRTVELNRTLARKFTDLVRRAVQRNDVVVMLPWNEDVPIVTGDRWHMATIIACGEPPQAMGSLPFRLSDRLEIGKVRISAKGIQERRRRSW